MRLLKYLATGVVIVALSACSGSKSAEQARLDSIHRADSIAAVQARLDSIRQDSIKKAEKIISAIPTFKEIDQLNHSILFKKKGFEVTYKKGRGWDNEICEEVIVDRVRAELNKGGEPSCSFAETEHGWSMTINGAPDVLAKFAADAKAYVANLKRLNPDDWYTQEINVTVSGNTVKMFWPEGD